MNKFFKIRKPVWSLSVLLILTSIYFLLVLKSIYIDFEVNAYANFNRIEFYFNLTVLLVFLLIGFVLIQYLSKCRGLRITDFGLIDNQYLLGVIRIKWSSIKDIRLVEARGKQILIVELSKESLNLVGGFNRFLFILQTKRLGGVKIPLNKMIESPKVISEEVIELFKNKTY